MRVLFVTCRAPGHLYSMVPLAWAFRSLGHEVRVAGLPACVPAIARAGLTAVPVGSDPAPTTLSSAPGISTWHDQTSWPVDWPSHPGQLTDAQWRLLGGLAGRQTRLADAMLDDLLDYGRYWRPDLVVYDAISLAGVVVAAALGVPAYSHSWGRATAMRTELADLVERPRPEYLRLFERAGIEPRTDPVGRIDPCPPSMVLPEPAAPPRVPIRFVPFNGPGVEPDWLRRPRDGARPRIAITGGVSAGDVSPQALPGFFDRTIRAAEKVGADIALAIGRGQAELSAAVPDPVRVVEAMPFCLLFPHCDVVIHQGSGGTMLTAAAAGVPQLVLPLRPEQQLSGDRLAAVGAGRQHVYNDLISRDDCVQVLAEDLARLLDEPAYRTSAAALRADIGRAPAPADVAAQLVAAR